MLPGQYIVFLLLVIGNLFAAALLETGQNVIKKTRLIKVLDKYPTTWNTDWNCEADFPVETCQRIRNQQIDIELVHIYTEELVCSAGWSASLPTDSGCTLPCQADSYGENCAFKCRCLNGRNCDPVDGSCDCYDGWKGHDCSTRCTDGEFGPNCKNKTHICENRGINHPVSGDCLCPDGYRGDRCEIECNPFTDELCGFDCERCDLIDTAAYCDHVVPSCRCEAGWRGLYCTEPCRPGFSGLFCHDSCCSGFGFCDEERNRCLCLDGYSGDNCENICEDGFFGRDCKERCSCPSCHHVTGKCDTCPHGYLGDRCSEPCPAGRWGPSCNESCVCQSGERCDILTGQCPREGGDDDFSTTKWQPSDRTDVLTPSTTLADGGTSSRVVSISLTLLALLVIIVCFLLLAYFCNRRRMERRRTSVTPGLSPRVIDDVKSEKENISNQRKENVYQSPESTETQPTENPYQKSLYSTVDLTPVNTSSDDNTYMTLNAESPGYASIGQ